MKKLIQNLIFYCFVIFITVSCKTQMIIYEPIGISDKPLYTIKIAPKCENKNDVDLYCLSNKDFKLLKEFIFQYQYNMISPIDSSNSGYSYGAYKIVFGGDKKSYIILDEKSLSYDFFEKQFHLLQSNSDLVKKIETLMKRLK